LCLEKRHAFISRITPRMSPSFARAHTSVPSLNKYLPGATFTTSPHCAMRIRMYEM